MTSAELLSEQERQLSLKVSDADTKVTFMKGQLGYANSQISILGKELADAYKKIGKAESNTEAIKIEENKLSAITSSARAEADAESKQQRVLMAGYFRKELGQEVASLQSTSSSLYRSANQIRSVSITYNVIVPIGSPAFQSYRDKLYAAAANFSGQNPSARRIGNTSFGLTRAGTDTDLILYQIQPSSDLYPSADNPLSDALRYPIILSIWRHTVVACPRFVYHGQS